MRSRSQSSGPASYDVLIGDTMGELMAMFGLGQIALVGGSLVPIGGHNVLEPAALGMPVLFGPHRQSFRAAGDALVEVGGGWEIHDASTLAAQITKLWTDTETARAAGAAAREVVRRNQGAVTRAVAAVDAIEVV